MLNVKQRQEYLQYLGYYKGKIDGKSGPLTRAAYLKLQKDYFFNKSDKDGKYGPNTDKLLCNCYNVKKYTKDFDIKKDKLYCRCKGKYCTGYPAYISISLLKNLQAERDKWGATTVTSLLRCKLWNKKQKGSTSSLHMKGRAVDYQNKHTKTLANRKDCINYWFTLENPRYSYCNGFYRNGNKTGVKVAKGMGNSVHGDVGK